MHILVDGMDHGAFIIQATAATPVKGGLPFYIFVVTAAVAPKTGTPLFIGQVLHTGIIIGESAGKSNGIDTFEHKGKHLCKSDRSYCALKGVLTSTTRFFPLICS